jgi:hypothetical protein
MARNNGGVLGNFIGTKGPVNCKSEIYSRFDAVGELMPARAVPNFIRKA